MVINMELWGITNNGRVRKHNEDVYRVLSHEDKGIAVLVVCDGMGGARAGHVASELAADVFMNHMSGVIESIEDVPSLREVALMMVEAVLTANTAVYEKSQKDEEYTGMGTTLIAAISTSSGEVVANVGDSRLYHATKKEITQITKDHSVVEDMIERGEITRIEARRHPSRNLITRALGTGTHEPPDIFYLNLASGDFLLLCSDGLSNVVQDNEMLIELQRGSTVRESCEVLVGIALARGAPDNVTAAILRK
jgi:protein phosphatase